MAKSHKIATLQTDLSAVRHQLDPPTPAAIATLQTLLNSKHAIIITQVAKLVDQHHLTDLLPDLATQFHRLLTQGSTTDPNCLAKTAIAHTLYRLDYPDTDLFLAGIHHIQMEPIWGGQADTAPGLRATCALGLVRRHYPDVMVELADLLADPEIAARVGAARAIAYSENPQGVPLLRLKLHLGDAEPQVLSECFIALLHLAPQASLPFVSRFLDAPAPAISELAALALGETRLPEAFAPIKQIWQGTRDRELRQSFLLAIATLQTEEAIQFLLGLVERGNLADAQDALSALHIYQHTADLWHSIQTIAQQRSDLEPQWSDSFSKRQQ